MKKETAHKIAESMIDETLEKDDDMITSVLGEVLNTMAGKTVSKLAPYGKFDISPPVFLKGNLVQAPRKSTKIMVLPIGLEQGLINVNFFIG